MFSVLRTLVPKLSTRYIPVAARHNVSSLSQKRPNLLVLGAAFTLSVSFAIYPTIHADAELKPDSVEDTVVDPATSIEFPTTLRIPSKFPLPEFSLVGVGVRTVSFLGIQVYSVGFYADLGNPNLKVPSSASPDEKIDYIVRNTACVLRIVPTRTTSYSHLRDGFVRALTARLLLAKNRGALSPEEEAGTMSPMLKFKSMFPTTPLAKHTPLDILLMAPSPHSNIPRSLVIRDVGSVDNNWVAIEFVLAYFEGKGLSPPLKDSVIARVQSL